MPNDPKLDTNDAPINVIAMTQIKRFVNIFKFFISESQKVDVFCALGNVLLKRKEFLESSLQNTTI